jgi:hypothetical protein
LRRRAALSVKNLLRFYEVRSKVRKNLLFLKKKKQKDFFLLVPRTEGDSERKPRSADKSLFASRIQLRNA